MDLVYAPKDVAENPAAVPEKYQFEKVWDRAPISEGHVALAQEGFRKLAERVCSLYLADWRRTSFLTEAILMQMLELRVHILPYFQDFDPWRRGLVSPSRFRRIINDIGLDVLTEFEWVSYSTRTVSVDDGGKTVQRSFHKSISHMLEQSPGLAQGFHS